MLNSALARTGLFQNQGLSLYLAVRQGNLVEAINILNSIRAPYLKDVCDEQGRPVRDLLEIASPHKEIVQLLLEVFPLGTDSGFSKENILKAFRTSAQNGYVDTLSYLIAHHRILFTPRIKEVFRESAEFGQAQVFMLLLQTYPHEIKHHEIPEAFLTASWFGQINIVRLCSEKFGEEIIGKHSEALRKAAYTGRLEIIDYLLAEHGAKLHKDYLYQSILKAIEEGHNQVVFSLLKYYQGSCGYFLEMASQYGRTLVVQTILNDYGDRVDNDNLGDLYRNYALQTSVQRGNLDVADLLLANPAVVAVAHLDNNFALRHAREHLQSGKLEYQRIVERLLNIQIVALLDQARRGDLEGLIATLSNTNNELSDAHKVLVYDAAVLCKRTGIVSYMLKTFGNTLPIDDVDKAFVNAAEANQLELISEMFNQVGHRLRPYPRRYAFMQAAARGALETVVLLHRLFDYDPEGDCYGQSFMSAAKNGHNHILRFLFDNCLDEIVNDTSNNNRGWALRKACGYESRKKFPDSKTVELLLDLCGDDISVAFKREALQDAKLCGNVQAVRALLTRYSDQLQPVTASSMMAISNQSANTYLPSMGLSVVKNEQEIEQNRSKMRP